MSSTCGSNAPGGDRNWNRSCPCCAATSALARVPRSAREMWSTVTSTPLAVPQSLAYLSNQTSYDGTKWLHWRILSDFCGRLIQTVGPSAAATVAPGVAAVTQLAGEGAARLSRESRRVRLVHAVKRPEAPVGIEVVAGLAPRAPASDVPLLLDVGEVLPQRLPVVEVAVQRELARRHVEARLEPPRRQVGPGDARAARVLPVEVADDVAAPAELRGPFREVEQRLELRQAGSLAVADAVGGIRPGGGRPRALHRRALELDVDRLSHREVVIQKDPRVPPPDLAPGAVPHREREVCQRHRCLAEHGCPVLADPNGGAAVRQVDEGEADAHLGLLIPERRRAI